MKSISRVYDSIKQLQPKHQLFAYKFIKFLQGNYLVNDEMYLYDMVTTLRYANKGGIGWTTRDKEIFLHAPEGGDIGEDYDKWEFIYIHECLHQIWDTFTVEDNIIKKHGKCIHDLLNIASDCVINDFIRYKLNKKYPTNNLITPEYMLAEFGVTYDSKNDNQLTLYEKCLPVKERILANSLVKKLNEQPPIINLPKYKRESIGGYNKKNYKDTTQNWKNGHAKAGFIINKLLFESYKKFNATDGNIKNIREALKYVLDQISAHVREDWKKYEFLSPETPDENIASPYRTFEEGWYSSFDERVPQINSLYIRLDPNYKPPKGPSTPPPKEQDVPDKDEEEPLALPQEPGDDEEDGGSSTETDEEDTNDDDKKKLDMPENNNEEDPEKKKQKPENEKSEDEKLDDKLKELQKELDKYSNNITPEQIVNKYKNSITGSLHDFFKKCKESIKTEGVGMMGLSRQGKIRGKWSQEFIKIATQEIQSKIQNIERKFKDSYSRPNRRTGVSNDGDILKKGRIEIKEGIVLSIKFYVDISGSMDTPPDSIKNILYIVWGICDNIKKINKQRKLIKDWNFLVYPFNTQILNPIPYHTKNITASGGNMEFSELLTEMKDISENVLLNVIITDAEWPVSVLPSLKIINNDINGTVIYITNAKDSQEGFKNCLEIEKKTPKFKLIPADNKWTIK